MNKIIHILKDGTKIWRYETALERMQRELDRIFAPKRFEIEEQKKSFEIKNNVELQK